MIWRVSLLIIITGVAAPITRSRAFAQDIRTLKAGVVRISNTRFGDVGTGFIVKIKKDRIYVVTSSHVVRGDKHPDVYLYNRAHDPLQATLLDREEDDLKGLALLTLKANEQDFSGLTAFSLGDSSQLEGGENITIIGFPDGTSAWTVSSDNVARLEGRNLALSKTIRAGYSGGPVISNGQVIGLVTDVSQEFAYAARSESIVSYVNGTVKNLIAITSTPPQPVVQNDEFCLILSKLLDASKGGFYSIVDKPAGIENPADPSSEGYFLPNIMLPGASGGMVKPKRAVYYMLMTTKEKSEVESRFYPTVAKVRSCLPDWVEVEETTGSFRIHKFKKGTPEVQVHYNLRHRNLKYILMLEIVIPDPQP